jgi:hypothetical protein
MQKTTVAQMHFCMVYLFSFGLLLIMLGLTISAECVALRWQSDIFVSYSMLYY